MGNLTNIGFTKLSAPYKAVREAMQELGKKVSLTRNNNQPTQVLSRHKKMNLGNKIYAVLHPKNFAKYMKSIKGIKPGEAHSINVKKGKALKAEGPSSATDSYMHEWGHAKDAKSGTEFLGDGIKAQLRNERAANRNAVRHLEGLGFESQSYKNGMRPAYHSYKNWAIKDGVNKARGGGLTATEKIPYSEVKKQYQLHPELRKKHWEI